MKPELPEIVLVTWMDAYGISTEEQNTLEELRAMEPHCMYVSVGFMPLPDDDNVILAYDVEINKKGHAVGYRGGSVVPRQCVLSIEKIGRKR